MIFKAILCVQHFYSFGAMLFIVNLLIKTDFAVICVPFMLERVLGTCVQNSIPLAS